MRAVTHNANFVSLASILRYAQRCSARIDFSTRESAEADLVPTNAFRDSTEAEDVGLRLLLP